MSGSAAPTAPRAAVEPFRSTSDDGDSRVEGRRMSTSSMRSAHEFAGITFTGKRALGGVARRTVGIILLLTTVFLWTVSNFLASTIFADDSFSKPYFVTYTNTSFFSVFLLGILIRRLWGTHGSIRKVIRGGGRHGRHGSMAAQEQEAFLKPAVSTDTLRRTSSSGTKPGGRRGRTSILANVVRSKNEGGLDVRETAKLSLEFCILWFAANYFVATCLEYTTVASSTILMSTTSIWTLLFGALIGVEHFTLKKLTGVLASLAGVMLISSVDLSGKTDENRGSFPHKSPTQIAIGDSLALGSAILYGFYTILMKKRIGDEGRVDMLLFFGFVGFFNTIALWPGFFILHFTGVEVFELPPTRKIWAIVLLNSTTSLISDFCWAYAMLLTSPLIVTVGISLSIPLSLVGQMIINSQNSGVVYWLGAGIVFLSFIFINHETKEEETTPPAVEAIDVEVFDDEDIENQD